MSQVEYSFKYIELLFGYVFFWQLNNMYLQNWGHTRHMWYKYGSYCKRIETCLAGYCVIIQGLIQFGGKKQAKNMH